MQPEVWSSTSSPTSSTTTYVNYFTFAASVLLGSSYLPPLVSARECLSACWPLATSVKSRWGVPTTYHAYSGPARECLPVPAGPTCWVQAPATKAYPSLAGKCLPVSAWCSLHPFLLPTYLPAEMEQDSGRGRIHPLLLPLYNGNHSTVFSKNIHPLLQPLFS